MYCPLESQMVFLSLPHVFLDFFTCSHICPFVPLLPARFHFMFSQKIPIFPYKVLPRQLCCLKSSPLTSSMYLPHPQTAMNPTCTYQLSDGCSPSEQPGTIPSQSDFVDVCWIITGWICILSHQQASLRRFWLKATKGLNHSKSVLHLHQTFTKITKILTTDYSNLMNNLNNRLTDWLYK